MGIYPFLKEHKLGFHFKFPTNNSRSLPTSLLVQIGCETHKMKKKKEAVSSLNVVICVVRYISNCFSLSRSQCFKVIRNKASISSLGCLCVKNRLPAVLPKEQQTTCSMRARWRLYLVMYTRIFTHFCFKISW